MQDLTIDFETYFDRDYSLSKLTMQQYLEDPRFEVMGCAIIDGHAPAQWLDAEDVPEFFNEVDWEETNMIGHNLLFDGAVLARHYGHLPKLYSCTLSFTRAILGAMLPRCNLETVAAYFGMKKDSLALFNMLGKHLADIDRHDMDAAGYLVPHASWQRYKSYATQDAIQARTIYNMLLPHMPGTERVVVDILIRMFVQGELVLDPVMVSEALIDAQTEAAQKLAAAGMSDRSELRSRQRFSEMLTNLGVAPPMKVSPATGLLTYAFAKNDLRFVELLEHPDPRVSTLVDAKLNASSTIHESRAVRLQEIANLSEDHRLQVPIAYSGAHTHRFSGLDKLNLQNVPKKTKLRRAIKAPKGKKLIVRDASQIEARMLAFVAGQWDLVEQFANGEDVYASFASSVFAKEINKTDHPGERFIGKTGILGLGYGSGAPTFHHMVMTSKERSSDIDAEFAAKVVGAYRRRYPQIVQLWRTGDLILPAIANGTRMKFGPCFTELCRLKLPSGLSLSYPQLEKVPEDQRLHPDWGVEWHYYKPRYRAHTAIFGAKLVENMIQALARIQITDTMIRMRVTNPDWHCALQVHDELVYVAPDDEAEDCDRYLSQYMNVQPAWAAGSYIPLPLANEGGIGEVYGDIK